MRLFTIGFTQSTAQSFFERLAAAGVRRVLDTRLNRTGQLSGFAKIPDLPYFLDRLGGIAYVDAADLAPTAELLKQARTRGTPFDVYARAYEALIAERRVERRYVAADLAAACLLCSEARAERCHRSVAAAYLQRTVAPELAIVHL